MKRYQLRKAVLNDELDLERRVRRYLSIPGLSKLRGGLCIDTSE